MKKHFLKDIEKYRIVRLFGNTARIRIVAVLSKEPFPLTIAEIAQKAKTNRCAAYTIIKKLQAVRMVKTTSVKYRKRYSLTNVMAKRR